jgi:hypothetical protein
MTSSNITKKPLSPPLSQPYYPPNQHTSGNSTSLRSPVAIPIQSPPLNTLRRESKAIPIVAPPPPPPATTTTATTTSAPLTKENLANNKNLTGTTTTSSVVTPNSNANSEIEALLLSFEGKPIQDKKQLLGDKLFPLVKVYILRLVDRYTN